MSVFSKTNSNSLEAAVRPGAFDIKGQQKELFPFDAFEFEVFDQTTGRATLRLKEPWKLSTDMLPEFGIDPRKLSPSTFYQIDGGTDVEDEGTRIFDGAKMSASWEEENIYNDVTSAFIDGEDNEKDLTVFPDGLIVLNNLVIKVNDGSNRSIELGKKGLLVSDSVGNTLHDIALIQDLDDAEFFGHYYQIVNNTPVIDYTVISSEAANTQTTYDRIITLSYDLDDFDYGTGVAPSATNMKGIKIGYYLLLTFSSTSKITSATRSIFNIGYYHSDADYAGLIYEQISLPFSYYFSTTYGPAFQTIDVPLYGDNNFKIVTESYTKGLDTVSSDVTIQAKMVLLGYYA